MRLPPLATNVIGSFPLSDSPGNFKRAIKDQVESGLDLVSYPQLADMNEMFLAPLLEGKGIEREGSNFIVNPDFDPTVSKSVRRWADDASDHLQRIQHGTPLRSCVTGPFTLASTVKAADLEPKPFPNGYVEMISERPWIVEELADYARKVCRYYSDSSSLISIDEPFLSVIVGGRKNLLEMTMSKSRSEELILETLDRALGGIGPLSALHVCGRIGPALSDILMGTDVDILSHEFSSMNKNFDAYESRDLESNSKILCVGVVTTSPTEDPGGIEPLDLVKRRMKNAIDTYSKDRVIFAPDCGFRPLKDSLGEENGQKVAVGKMKTMTRAKSEILEDLGLGIGEE